MLVDIPYSYSATVLLRSGGEARFSIKARESLHISDHDAEEAPVAARWRVPGRDWWHVRTLEGGVLAPLLDGDGKDTHARARLVALLRTGWAGEESADADGETVSESDWRIRRFLADDKGARLTAIRRRAAMLRVVGGIPYAPCGEPLLVEVAGQVEVRMAAPADWMRAHPLSEASSAIASARRTGGTGAMAHEVEILDASGLAVDRGHILGKVTARALALTKRHCEATPGAGRDAAAAEDALARGRGTEAAVAMARCLGLMAGSGVASQGAADYVGRALSYLTLYCPRAVRAAA